MRSTGVFDDLGIEIDPTNLSMPGLPTADRLIAGVFELPPRIPRLNLVDALEPLQNSLNTPETSSSDDGLAQHS